MKRIIQLEELAQMALGILGLSMLAPEFSWWVWILLFLSPDISFIAYIAGMKAGTVVYNIFHHRGIAIATAAAGLWMNSDLMMLAGIILYTHACFDRMLGYGLKFPTGFKHTHLDGLERTGVFSNEKLSEL